MSEFKDGLKPIRVGIEGVSYSLTHVPDLVRYGSKPLREIRAQPALGEQLAKRLRDFAAATAYAPHQVYIGNIAPEKLSDLPKPWYEKIDRRRDSQGPLRRSGRASEVLRACSPAPISSIWLRLKRVGFYEHAARLFDRSRAAIAIARRDSNALREGRAARFMPATG